MTFILITNGFVKVETGKSGWGSNSCLKKDIASQQIYISTCKKKTYRVDAFTHIDVKHRIDKTAQIHFVCYTFYL